MFRKSGKFTKFGLSGNRSFSFPDAGLLTLLKVEKKSKNFIFFSKFFSSIPRFSNTSYFQVFDFKFVSTDLTLRESIAHTWYVKCLKNISPDLFPSDRTCPANSGVRSCPVRKLICPMSIPLKV